LIICFCKKLNDKKIAEESKSTFEDLVKKTGATTCCGGCYYAVYDIWTKTKHDEKIKENEIIK